MFSEKGIWIGVALIIIEILVIVFIVNPKAVEEAILAEQETVNRLFGNAVGERSRKWALATFEKHFIESGVLPFISRMYSRTSEERDRSTGMETMGVGLEGWAAERLGALHQSLYGVYHRVYLIGLMLLLSGALMIAGVVDALFQRQIQIVNFETSNAVYYHGAKKGLFWFAVVPLLVLFAPVKVSAFWFVLWGLMIPVMMWIGARNVQELA